MITYDAFVLFGQNFGRVEVLLEPIPTAWLSIPILTTLGASFHSIKQPVGLTFTTAGGLSENPGIRQKILS